MLPKLSDHPADPGRGRAPELRRRSDRRNKARSWRLPPPAPAKVAPLDSVSCCGYAGDKGLFTPELNEWATRFVKNDIPADCQVGVSTVSTFAAGLSERAGIPFVSLASLLEYVSRPAA